VEQENVVTRGRNLLLCVVLLLSGLAPAAMGQQAPQPLIDKPVYDPVSKRYFELVRLGGFDGTWLLTEKFAEDQFLKGVHGRLAIVDSIEIHEFLLHTFRPNHSQWAWIGLRYLCRQQQLQWSDGSLWKGGSFQAWDTDWKQDIYFCAGASVDPNDWAPVAYAPPPNFRWIGKGRGKGYEYAFIEFPTGQP
jgi:hypothetical protein